MLQHVFFESEIYETGCLVSQENTKKFIMRDSNQFPITYRKVEEFLKMISKEVLSVLKAGKGNKVMMTLYGQDDFFETENICRFTFEVWNGKVVVQYRMHIQDEGFPIAVETEFDSNVKAKNYVVNMIDSHIHEMIVIKDNDKNYFTKNLS